jgi:hypothetical protein
VQAPEEALITAILERALLDIFTHRGAIRMSAMEWIDNKSTKPFTFLYICEHLELDPQVLRDIARKVYSCDATLEKLAPRTKNGFLRRFLAHNHAEITLKWPGKGAQKMNRGS